MKFFCLNQTRLGTGSADFNQWDTVADVWATLTWSPYVSGPSPADLSQWRLILLDAYGFHAGVLITRQRVLLDAYGFHPGVSVHVCCLGARWAATVLFYGGLERKVG